MPVQKFRSVENMPPVPDCERGSVEHWQRVESLWTRAHALANKRFKRGVFRFRGVEEIWEQNMEAPRPVRRKKDDAASGWLRLPE